MKRFLITMVLSCFAVSAADKKDNPKPPASSLDQYVDEAYLNAEAFIPATPGSLWVARASFSDIARDLRARNVNDLVIIDVTERSSALARGDLQSSRQSNLNASIASAALPKAAAPALAGLANTTLDSQVNGQASTSRETLVTTRMGARVTRVLPNGYLVVEGSKEIQLNSERQLVTVRGVVRPNDLATDNSVLSSRLAQLEVRVNGKGVVGDAIRRPFFLYRLLMGILPL